MSPVLPWPSIKIKWSSPNLNAITMRREHLQRNTSILDRHAWNGADEKAAQPMRAERRALIVLEHVERFLAGR